jgi:hypothetical protein
MCISKLHAYILNDGSLVIIKFNYLLACYPTVEILLTLYHDKQNMPVLVIAVGLILI